MPSDRVSMPNALQLRVRIRKWLRYYLGEYKGDMNQQEIAEALDVSPTTISQLKLDKVNPGLDTFVRMHFVFGGDLVTMVRKDPPTTAETRTTADRLRQKMSK